MSVNYQPSYKTIKCKLLSDEQLEACATLFSLNYGEYSGLDNPQRQGQRIKLKAGYYRNMGDNPNMYVSLCYNGSQLLGHAF